MSIVTKCGMTPDLFALCLQHSCSQEINNLIYNLYTGKSLGEYSNYINKLTSLLYFNKNKQFNPIGDNVLCS